MSPIRRPIPVAALTLALAATAARADTVLDWNRVATDVLRDNTTLQDPGMASRSMAMVNLAIYDAFEMTDPAGQMFYRYEDAPSSYGASAKAAASQAAYTVLSGVYADQQTTLDAALATSLGAIAEGDAKAEGVTLGQMIGQTILDRRAGDGYDAMSPYQPSDGPGRWRPDPLNPGQQAWGPAWGDVRPFALPSNRTHLPPPMPELTSAKYAEAFDEVKRLGSIDSIDRTAEHTEIGYFWAYDRLGMGTPMRLFNDVLQTIAVQRGNDVKKNAELFAKATVAMADAGIVSWNSKFEYDLWRPVTGIREADTDGNPLTVADPDWTPLGAPDDDGGVGFTPPFPTYLSGHATFGGALFGTLQEFYGTDDIAFSLGSEELPGVVREFESLSEAMAENGRSRVYLGIHWNFDDTVGQQVGADIARTISRAPFVAAIPEPASVGLLGVAALAVTGRGRRAA